MTSAITQVTEQFSAPYLTIQEFKDAPTAIDWSNLVVGGDLAAQNAELQNVIIRASSWIDQYCNQIIGATLTSETQRVRVRGDGTLRWHPRYSPVVSLESLDYGNMPNQLTSVTDVSPAWIEEQEIIFPYANLSTTYSSQGPLSFGFPYTQGMETFIKYTYVNGYANTTIVTAAQAATSLTVANGRGIVAGQSLRIYDGSKTENVIVASTYTYGSTTVPLTSALVYAHNAGISISALPAAVKQAAILATTSFIKTRGDNALVLAVTTTPSQQVSGAQNIGTELAIAQDLLKPFRRII